MKNLFRRCALPKLKPTLIRQIDDALHHLTSQDQLAVMRYEYERQRRQRDELSKLSRLLVMSRTLADVRIHRRLSEMLRNALDAERTLTDNAFLRSSPLECCPAEQRWRDAMMVDAVEEGIKNF